MSGPGRFAVCYFRHGVASDDFGDDLRNLVESSRYAEEMGERSTSGVYELTADGWVPADVDDLIAEIDAEMREHERELAAAASQWRVMVTGPSGHPTWWSSAATEEEARAAAAEIDSGFRPTVELAP